MPNDQYINGQLQDLSDKVDMVIERLTGNDGIQMKVNAISEHTKHLEKLPMMAYAMRLQAWTSLALTAFLCIIVLVVVIKGTNLRVTIPGWFEISGNHGFSEATK